MAYSRFAIDPLSDLVRMSRASLLFGKALKVSKVGEGEVYRDRFPEESFWIPAFAGMTEKVWE